jgi:hypothetical protein
LPRNLLLWYTLDMKTLLLSLLLLSLCSVSQAQQVITLKDGSQVKGELAGVVNGVYTVKTPVIGEVHVAAKDVVSISNGSLPVPNAQPVAAAPAPQSGFNQQIQDAQARLMSNPETMMALQQLAQDPVIAPLLSDPQLIAAVTSKDANAIANNPKAKKLMEDPRMQKLMRQLQASSK